jgi:DNA-binding NtrC family response regulator
MSGQRLLIVENYEPVAQILATALADDFERIAIARSLTEARALHAQADGPLFDLVICSSALPDGQGTDFKEWLDARADTGQKLPFVLIAGSLPGLRRTRADFVILSKPFMMEELLQAIQEAKALSSPPEGR